MSTDLKGKRVSADDAYQDVTRMRARVDKLERENRALRKDRNDLLTEYETLREIKFKKPPAVAPKNHGKREFTRVVVGDVHGMMMQKDAVMAFLGDLKRWQPEEIVLGGDIVECGGWLAKHQTLGYVAQTSYSYQEDIMAANWFLDEIQTRCPEAVIHYLEGNHEDRIERWAVDQTQSHQRDAEFLRALASPDVLLRLEARNIQFYRRAKVYLQGLPPGWIKLGKIFFVHELGTSKNAARDSVGKTAGNVVFFHTHREDTATMNLPGVGLVKAFNPGCLCQLQPLWKHSAPTDWTHGYGVQFISKTGHFLHHNIPIWQGASLVGSVLDHITR